MKILIYQGDDEPCCVHMMKVYENAIFQDNFTEVSIPEFTEMKGSYCINYCIQTKLCNAMFIAKSMEYWCKAYRIHRNEANITALTSSMSAPVINTWNGGAIPNESELTLIDFDACCPNACSSGSVCKNNKDTSFTCIFGSFEGLQIQWTGPKAVVYIPFDEGLTPDEVVGNFQLTDGVSEQALYLDGSTSIDINTPGGNMACWKHVSSCKTTGFSVAFWIQVISNTGFENHQDQVGVLTAMRATNKEGWEVNLLNYNHNLLLKMRVNNLLIPGKLALKEFDENFPLNEWIHYIAVYQYTEPNDDANVLFHMYKNGQSYNNRYGHYSSGTIESDIVQKLVFGRRYFSTESGPYSNVKLDEVLVFNGSLDASQVLNLYQNYQT